MEPKKKNNTATAIIVVSLIVGLGAVALMFVGILAAISIPAFLRYIKLSKTAQGETVVRRVANDIVAYHSEHCAFPPVLEPSSPMPMSGEKVMPNKLGEGWKALGYTTLEPSYFQYSTEQSGTDVTVYALADFNPGPPFHTIAVELSRPGETCLLDVGTVYTINEFE